MKRILMGLASLLAGVSMAAQNYAPNWYSQVQGGVGYTIGETTTGNLLSPAGSVSGGFRFNSLLGFRFGFSGYLGKGDVLKPFETYKFNYLQGNLDLTVSLASLVAGDHQVWPVKPFVFVGTGVAYGFNNGALNVQLTAPKDYFELLWGRRMISPIGRFGAGVDIDLTRIVALSFEVNGNLLSDSFNSKKGGTLDSQYNVLAGLKFFFAQGSRSAGKNWKRDNRQGHGKDAGKIRPQNNHTLSTTLGLGLEYGFEWAFAGQATVIGRVGYASKDFTLRNSLDNFQWSSTMAPMVTLEPRYYFLMNWREAHGKYTSGNSAEFFSVPTSLTLAKDARGIGELAVSPVLGVRRAFARHWFHEFTAGADLLCLPKFFVTPHVGYRIGFIF